MDKTCKSSGILLVAILVRFSGARVRNTWAICLGERDSSAKVELIPHKTTKAFLGSQRWRKLPLLDEPAAYQLVGGVTAHQGDDG